MKRYSPSVKFLNSQGEYLDMQEDSDGLYVRIDDVPGVFKARIVEKEKLIELFNKFNYFGPEAIKFHKDLEELIDRVAGRDTYLMIDNNNLTYDIEDNKWAFPNESFSVLEP